MNAIIQHCADCMHDAFGVERDSLGYAILATAGDNDGWYVLLSPANAKSPLYEFKCAKDEDTVTVTVFTKASVFSTQF